MNGKDKVEVAIVPGVEFKGVALTNISMGQSCGCRLRSDGVLEIFPTPHHEHCDIDPVTLTWARDIKTGEIAKVCRSCREQILAGENDLPTRGMEIKII